MQIKPFQLNKPNIYVAVNLFAGAVAPGREPLNNKLPKQPSICKCMVRFVACLSETMFANG